MLNSKIFEKIETIADKKARYIELYKQLMALFAHFSEQGLSASMIAKKVNLPIEQVNDVLDEHRFLTQVHDLLKQNMSLKDISQKLNVPSGTLYARYRKYFPEVFANKSAAKKDLDDKIAMLASQKLKPTAIANKLGIPVWKVTNTLVRRLPHLYKHFVSKPTNKLMMIDRVFSMDKDGKSYYQIANASNLSVDTVKDILQRRQLIEKVREWMIEGFDIPTIAKVLKISENSIRFIAKRYLTDLPNQKKELRNAFLDQIKKLKLAGKTTQEIADLLDAPVHKVNNIIQRNLAGVLPAKR